MKIFLIRHGEATAEKEGTPLTELGLKQAQALAKKLSKLNVTNVYSSELERAKQTCNELVKLKKELKPIFTEELNEIYRVIVGGPEKEGTSEGREERDEKRAEDFFNKVLLCCKEDTAIFCHGNIIRYFVAKLEKRNPKEMWEGLQINPASAMIYNKEKDCFEEGIESGVDVDSKEYL